MLDPLIGALKSGAPNDPGLIQERHGRSGTGDSRHNGASFRQMFEGDTTASAGASVAEIPDDVMTVDPMEKAGVVDASAEQSEEIPVTMNLRPEQTPSKPGNVPEFPSLIRRPSVEQPPKIAEGQPAAVHSSGNPTYSDDKDKPQGDIAKLNAMPDHDFKPSMPPPTTKTDRHSSESPKVATQPKAPAPQQSQLFVPIGTTHDGVDSVRTFARQHEMAPIDRFQAPQEVAPERLRVGSEADRTAQDTPRPEIRLATEAPMVPLLSSKGDVPTGERQIASSFPAGVHLTDHVVDEPVILPPDRSVDGLRKRSGVATPDAVTPAIEKNEFLAGSTPRVDGAHARLNQEDSLLAQSQQQVVIEEPAIARSSPEKPPVDRETSNRAPMDRPVFAPLRSGEFQSHEVAIVAQPTALAQRDRIGAATNGLGAPLSTDLFDAPKQTRNTDAVVSARAQPTDQASVSVAPLPKEHVQRNPVTGVSAHDPEKAVNHTSRAADNFGPAMRPLGSNLSALPPVRPGGGPMSLPVDMITIPVKNSEATILPRAMPDTVVTMTGMSQSQVPITQPAITTRLIPPAPEGGELTEMMRHAPMTVHERLRTAGFVSDLLSATQLTQSSDDLPPRVPGFDERALRPTPAMLQAEDPRPGPASPEGYRSRYSLPEPAPTGQPYMAPPASAPTRIAPAITGGMADLTSNATEHSQQRLPPSEIMRPGEWSGVSDPRVMSEQGRLLSHDAVANPSRTADIARQISTQIAMPMRTGAEQTIDITLNPAELGRVQLSLTPGDGTMAVSIAAERPETLDLIRRHIDQLMQDLRDMGYGSTEFSFGGQSAQDGQTETQADGPGNDASTSDGVPINDGAGAGATHLNASAEGLDLRL